MGHSKSSGIDSPWQTKRSSTISMSCKALPTLPMSTVTTEVTLVGGAVMVVTATTMSESLNLDVVMVVGEMQESEVAMKECSGKHFSFVCGAILRCLWME